MIPGAEFFRFGAQGADEVSDGRAASYSGSNHRPAGPDAALAMRVLDDAALKPPAGARVAIVEFSDLK